MADDPHDEVRARLASEPSPRMPDDVASRLHDALATEAQARQASGPTQPDVGRSPATVTQLPSRGRWRAPLLAAAGVVAVVAIGIPVINQVSNQGAGDAGSSGPAAEDSTRFNGAQKAPESGSPDASDQEAPEAAPESMVERFRRAPMDLHRRTFASDVSGYLGPRARASAPSALEGSVSAAVSCTGTRPAAPGGLAATLDEDPAVILATPGKSGGIRVRAVVCADDGPEVAAQTTLDRG